MWMLLTRDEQRRRAKQGRAAYVLRRTLWAKKIGNIGASRNKKCRNVTLLHVRADLRDPLLSEGEEIGSGRNGVPANRPQNIVLCVPRHDPHPVGLLCGEANTVLPENQW